MKKLLTLTILLTTLISCSQDTGIEEYTCDMYEQTNFILLTFDTENNLWKAEYNEIGIDLGFQGRNGRISQENDYYFAMHELDYYGSEGMSLFFNKKEKQLFNGEGKDGINISYFSSLETEENQIANCK